MSVGTERGYPPIDELKLQGLRALGDVSAVSVAGDAGWIIYNEFDDFSRHWGRSAERLEGWIYHAASRLAQRLVADQCASP